MKRILIFAPTPAGGLAEHVFYQARALHQLGLSVTCLTTGSFLSGREAEFKIRRRLFDMPPSPWSKIFRRPLQVISLVVNEWLLAAWILWLRARIAFCWRRIRNTCRHYGSGRTGGCPGFSKFATRPICTTPFAKLCSALPGGMTFPAASPTGHCVWCWCMDRSRSRRRWSGLGDQRRSAGRLV